MTSDQPERTIRELLFERAAQKRRQAPQRRRAQPRSGACADSPRLSATQRRGIQYEAMALEYLQARGLVLLARNLRCPFGEIDLVMRERGTLVWVEVRYRQSAAFGGAAGSITAHKKQRLQRSAACLLPGITWRCFGGRTPPCRFDVISISGPDSDIAWLTHVLP